MYLQILSQHVVTNGPIDDLTHVLNLNNMLVVILIPTLYRGIPVILMPNLFRGILYLVLHYSEEFFIQIPNMYSEESFIQILSECPFLVICYSDFACD